LPPWPTNWPARPPPAPPRHPPAHPDPDPGAIHVPRHRIDRERRSRAGPRADQAGAPVRALTRRDTGRPTPAGVQLAVGDLNRGRRRCANALAGVRGLFLLPGYQDMKGLLAEAASAGVQRVVLLSGSSADGDQSNAITRYMSASEAAVHGSGLALDGAAAQRLHVQHPGVGAAAARRGPGARAVRRGPRGQPSTRPTSRRSRRWPCSTRGTPADLPADRARGAAGRRPGRCAGQVLGRPLRFAGQPDDEARAELSASMPVEYVEAFFNFYVEGALDESPVLPTVAELTGRPARTFRDWAKAHAAELA